MTSKITKVALTQLKNLLKEAEEKIINLELALKSQKEYKEMYQRNNIELDKQIESIHSVLDVLPRVIARKTVPDADRPYHIVEHSVVTRLCSFLAAKQ